jgi:hypothetical protein
MLIGAVMIARRDECARAVSTVLGTPSRWSALLAGIMTGTGLSVLVAAAWLVNAGMPRSDLVQARAWAEPNPVGSAAPVRHGRHAGCLLPTGCGAEADRTHPVPVPEDPTAAREDSLSR